MPKYKRVSSFKIMNDYKITAKHLRYIGAMADIRNKRFFRINKEKIEANILASKMTNREKHNLILMIQNGDYHEVYCYSQKLYTKYRKVYNNYESRMEDLFMTIEDKAIFYA